MQKKVSLTHFFFAQFSYYDNSINTTIEKSLEEAFYETGPFLHKLSAIKVRISMLFIR